MQRASDIIAERLRRMITTREIEPGSLVSESQLAERLECGRTPLREALQRLSSEGVLEVVPRRGVLIPELGLLEFQEISAAVLLVGDYCLNLAAERITDEELERFRENVAKAERSHEAGNFLEVADLDRQFHILVAKASRNRFLAEATSKWYSIAMRYSYYSYVQNGTAIDSLAEHERILAALEARNGDDAVLEHHEHISGAKQRIAGTLWR